LLAPLALIAVIVGGYLIVHHNLSTKSHAAVTTTAHRHASVPRGKYARQRFYTVQANDSLTSISATTGVNIATLEALNRSIDPNALQPGQRIRIRR
jgi:spore germination protein YaaH